MSLRGLILAVIAGPIVLVAAVTGARAGESLVVRRPNPATAALSPAAGASRSPLDAEVARRDQEHRAIAARRLARDRLFPHRVSHPAVDWHPRANRRRGWVEPAWAIGDPHRRPAGRSTAASGGATPARAAATPADTVRVAFLRIDFLADRGASSGDGRFDLSGPDLTQPPIDRAPHNRDFYLAHLEALRRYYDAQTYGRVVIAGDVWPRDQTTAYSVSDMADFGPWAYNDEIYADAVHMFRTMMFAADSQATDIGDPIPWDLYDRFVIIHAGSDLQSDLNGDSPQDIPSFTIGVGDTDVVIFPDSLNRPIDRAALVPETINQDGFYGAINGVLAHENGHNLFGYADLYDVQSGFPVVGVWSLMDSGNLAGAPVQVPSGEEIYATGILPPSVDPFHRLFSTDALQLIEPAAGDTVALPHSERFPEMVRVFLTGDEYLMIENRYVSPSPTLELDQDPVTRVILGPKVPDGLEYDALLPVLDANQPGGGVLVWHIDASVVPFATAFRPNPDFGFNTDPARRGVSVIEADALADLGDPGSPFIFGSWYDPYFQGNYATLSDTTRPNLLPHLGTRPHLRIDVLDPPGPTMRVRVQRNWQLEGWPVTAEFPPGGPILLAVDADGGDRRQEVCWAGGGDGSPDSASLFAYRMNGRGLFGATPIFATLDARPRPAMAALPTGAAGLPGRPAEGPSWFAVSTYAYGPDGGGATAGGQVWLLDHFGQARPGWPVTLPAPASTPPVIAGSYPSARVLVGAADGHVYALGLDGQVVATSDRALPGGVSGRLAVDIAPDASGLVGAGGGQGDLAVLRLEGASLLVLGGWPQRVAASGFEPDFLWIDFDGGRPAGTSPACPGTRTLIAHHADRLWAFCPDGGALSGWGRALGDTLVAALGAADPDGDGYAEVLTQSLTSRVAFFNQSGYPSPGWPRQVSREPFRTDSAPLGVDVDGDGRSEIVAMNASGELAAVGLATTPPAGWPLATGAGAVGAPLAVDLDFDRNLEIIAPDRWLPDSMRAFEQANGRFGTLIAYSIPTGGSTPTVNAWPMLGGDPGRTSALPAARTALPPAAASGPLIEGSLMAYPNPAKRRPISFAYRLTEPADVEFRILDTSGHEVAAFTRAGRQSDNLEVWDPGNVPAGLYVARLRFRGSAAEHQATITLGLIR